MSTARLDNERAALIVIDVQEGFAKAIPGFGRIAAAASTLVRGAEILGMPVIITEQYPKGLGPTVAEVAGALPAGTKPLEKLEFSAADATGFDLQGRDQALVCGIEAHVCVNQTVLGLLAEGIELHVAVDAAGSRFREARQIGLRKMEGAGAVLTSVETALFELLGRAGTDEFKAIQRLVLEFAPTPPRAGETEPTTGVMDQVRL